MYNPKLFSAASDQKPVTTKISNFVSIDTDEMITITTPEETITLNNKGKVYHYDQGGEAVFEFSGVTTDDKRQDRSWAIACFRKEGQSPLHYHAERTEDYFIVSGADARVIIDGKEYPLSPGEKITIHSGQAHQVLNGGTTELILAVRCSPSWIPADYHLIKTAEDVVEKRNTPS